MSDSMKNGCLSENINMNSKKECLSLNKKIGVGKIYLKNKPLEKIVCR